MFGAPCNYASMDGPVRKRAALMEEGYFVGIQNPMALVIRKRDIMKLISVSTENIKVYESAYIAPLESKPAAEFEHAEIVKDSGEASTTIETEVPETEVSAGTIA